MRRRMDNGPDSRPPVIDRKVLRSPDSPTAQRTANRTQNLDETVGCTKAGGRLPRWHSYVMVGLLSVLCYANSISNEFSYDDNFAVVQNPDVSGATHLLEVFRHDYWGKDILSPLSHKSYRPLTTFTFRINHFWGQTDPTSYHVVNLALHVAVSLLFLAFTGNIAGDQQLDNGSLLSCSSLSSMMFAVHPVHTEAVTSVVGRAELLSALFVLAGLLAHQRRATLAAVLFIEFAHFCKETGLLGFPLMIWMDSALELPESTGRTQRECLTGRCRRWAGLLFVMSANIGARYWLLDGKTLPSFTKIDNPLWFQPRFADQLFATVRVHMEYARLLIFPDRLSCDYSLQCIVSCDSSFCQATAVTLYATVFFAFAWVSSLQLCRCCAYASQRSVLPSHVRWTVPVFAIGFAAISLVPAAHFFKVGLLVAERLLYTPSMGTCLFVGWLLSRVAIGTAEKLQRSCWRRCAVGLLASNILVVCIVRCIARNEEWATPDELYISAVHTCPTSARIHNNLGTRLLRQHAINDAGYHFQAAVDAEPDFPLALHNLGLSHYFQGNKEQAVKLYIKSLEMPDQSNVMALNNLIICLRELNRTAEAATYAEYKKRLATISQAW